MSPSPWPFAVRVSLVLCFSFLVYYFHVHCLSPFLLRFFLIVLVLRFWFSDFIKEGTFLGYHTVRVQHGLRLGVVLFIISEIFFFLSFFWAYLHFSLSPAVELGSLWPPIGIRCVSFAGIPLLNTCLLLLSGATLTCSHSFLLSRDYTSSFSWLCSTIFLGLLFLCFQGWEYFASSFTISDSAFGSSFYLATGFHGLHVLVGSLLLFLSLLRLRFGHFSSSRHLGLEASIWYWHFVDVIWLLLFLIIYVWGTFCKGKLIKLLGSYLSNGIFPLPFVLAQPH